MKKLALLTSLIVVSGIVFGQVLLDTDGSLTESDPTFSDNTHYDEYEVRVTRGQVLRAAIMSRGSDRIDPYLIIDLPDGTSLENDDYTSRRADSRIDDIRVQASGTMLVTVSTYAYNQDSNFSSSGTHLALETGQYRVWVASVEIPFPEDSGVAVPPGGAGVETASLGLDTSAPASQRSLSLRAGFSPDPHRLTGLSAGGPNRISGAFASGYADAVADVELTYSAGEYPLYIATETQGDTVLFVCDPEGVVRSNDDDGTDQNARVHIDSPTSGTYRIWIGTYSDAEMHNVTLSFSEVEP